MAETDPAYFFAGRHRNSGAPAVAEFAAGSYVAPSGADRAEQAEQNSPTAIGDVVRQIDEIDRKLLALLQDDDRLALTELSKRIGVAASTLNDRIKRLVNQGLITGFHARLSSEALGLDLLAFMLVSWSDPKVEPQFLSKVRASPAVLECHHVTGEWNYLLKVRIRNTKDLESFLSGTIKAVRGVERTQTLITLSTAKETWALEVPKSE
jgi:Lrp/AsnC family transcriptional regulator, leucine-responsive regulatory protein